MNNIKIGKIGLGAKLYAVDGKEYMLLKNYIDERLDVITTQIQSDLAQTDNTKKDFVKNKKTSNLENDSDFVSDADYVHTDNNYDDAAVLEVAKIADKQDATDALLETDSDTIVGAINEVNSIAKGANQALSFDDYQAVIAAMLVNGLNAGQNLYVDTLDVPDLWVKVVEVASVPYTYVSDTQFVTDILAGTQIGYYRLSLLETQKVDLTNYYTKDETDQAIEDYAEPLRTTDQNYVSDAELEVLQNTSGVNTGDETQDTIGDLIELTELATVTDTTKIAASDSAFLKWFSGLTIYTYIRTKLLAVANTWALLQTFTSGLKTTKIIPNSDTTGVVIRNAADTADVVKFDLEKFSANIITDKGTVRVGKLTDLNANINTGFNFNFNNSLYSGLVTEVNNQLLDFGVNDGVFGVVNAAFSGGIFRFDCRQSANLFQIIRKPIAGSPIIAFSMSLANGSIGVGHANNGQETLFDVNGTTTLRDWVYLNNGTHTGDAVGDRRYKVVSDVYTLQRCAVNSATKGDATVGNWLTIYTNDANGFELDQYDDVLPSTEWTPASGGAAPDIATHTIGTIAANYRAFDGGNTEESMTSSFEILHGIDVDALNRVTTPLLAEVHTHGMAATNGSGVVKIFYDIVYQGVNMAPEFLGTFTNLITVNANEQYWHKLGGVEFTKPTGDFAIGGQLIVKYRRNPSDAQDTYTGDWLFMQCALHMPFNSNGSRQRYIK